MERATSWVPLSVHSIPVITKHNTRDTNHFTRIVSPLIIFPSRREGSSLFLELTELKKMDILVTPCMQTKILSSCDLFIAISSTIFATIGFRTKWPQHGWCEDLARQKSWGALGW
jgi:hypothetical protein